MDLNLLKIFIKVANYGSLTQAAKALNHPKSKLSRDLDKLEENLEMSLLNRSPRGVTLTEQGHKLLRTVGGLLDELEASMNSLTEAIDEVKGNIKLTAPEDLSSSILAEVVYNFMKIYPGVRVDFFSTNTILDFQQHQIDLALRIGRLEDSNLIQKKICNIDAVLVGAASYLKGRPEIKKIEDLKNIPVAMLKDLHGHTLDPSELSLIKSTFSSNSTVILKKFVEEGLGVATLPTFLYKKELLEGTFVRILPEFSYLKRSLFLLSRPSKYIPIQVKVFKEYLYSELGKILV